MFRNKILKKEKFQKYMSSYSPQEQPCLSDSVFTPDLLGDKYSGLKGGESWEYKEQCLLDEVVTAGLVT